MARSQLQIAVQIDDAFAESVEDSILIRTATAALQHAAIAGPVSLSQVAPPSAPVLLMSRRLEMLRFIVSLPSG